MGTPNRWLSSYLDNRTQQCFVNGSLSNTYTLLCGVSQGTILGPLLFLLYINDLPSCLSSSEPRMCADDIHLTCAGNEIYSIQSSLNRDLLNISHWLTANKLTLDMTKTEFMSIGTRQKLNNLPSPTAIEINVTGINQVYSNKSLSIIIDGNLTWVNHIDILSKKNCCWYWSYQTNHTLCTSRNSTWYIYRGIVQSHFDYCNVVWDNCGKNSFA